MIKKAYQAKSYENFAKIYSDSFRLENRLRHTSRPAKTTESRESQILLSCLRCDNCQFPKSAISVISTAESPCAITFRLSIMDNSSFTLQQIELTVTFTKLPCFSEFRSQLGNASQKCDKSGTLVPNSENERVIRSKLYWRRRHRSRHHHSGRCSCCFCPLFVHLYKNINVFGSEGLVCAAQDTSTHQHCAFTKLPGTERLLVRSAITKAE